MKSNICIMVAGKWYYMMEATRGTIKSALLPDVECLTGIICESGFETSAVCISVPLTQIQAFTDSYGHLKQSGAIK